jgi:hypothetical protein
MNKWKVRRQKAYANKVRHYHKREKVKRTVWYRLKKLCRIFTGRIF